MKSFNEQNQDYIFRLMKKWRKIASEQLELNKKLNHELKKCNCGQGSNNEG